MIIIPAIDLLSGSCVRLSQGSKASAVIYDRDPVRVARDFVDQGAEMLHVVDLDGAFSQIESRNYEALTKITKAVDIPIQFGGGLRSLSDVARALDIGVARVVIGTVAVESPDILSLMIEEFGAARIAVALDAKDEQVVTRGWENEGDLNILALAQRIAVAGVERIVYTDIKRDGMLKGPNVERTMQIARHTGLKITASGGVSALSDLLELRRTEAVGVDSVIVGKALYEKCFRLAEAIQVCKNRD